jgi:hyperosmotically inducible periplasmic protein
MRKLFGLAAVAVFFVASAVADKQQTHSDVFTSGPQDESPLAREVRHNLLMLPYYSIFADLYFEVNGSVVTLKGACPSEPPWDIKSDAENAVKNIQGVTKVVNEIRELPLSPFDWQIRRAVAKALYGDPEIGMRYAAQALPSVHIIVENGHLTLDGVVDNQMDDTLIRARASSVPNVFSVTDNLTVLNTNQTKKTGK